MIYSTSVYPINQCLVVADYVFRSYDSCVNNAPLQGINGISWYGQNTAIFLLSYAKISWVWILETLCCLRFGLLTCCNQNNSLSSFFILHTHCTSLLFSGDNKSDSALDYYVTLHFQKSSEARGTGTVEGVELSPHCRSSCIPQGRAVQYNFCSL